MSSLHLHIAHLLTALLSVLLEFHLSGTKPLQVIKSGPGISRFLAHSELQKEQHNHIATNVQYRLKRNTSRLTVTQMRVLKSPDCCPGLPFIRFRRRSWFPKVIFWVVLSFY